MKIELLEGETGDDVVESFNAWLKEVLHKLETNDYEIKRPKKPPEEIRINNTGILDFSKRTYMLMDGFCDNFPLYIAFLRRSEANGFHASFITMPPPGRMILYLPTNEDTNPNNVMNAELVFKHIQNIDDNDDTPIKKVLIHEYGHFLQEAGGFENIKRNIIMCYTPYLQLKWEIETHAIEFYYSFVRRIEEAPTREVALQALKSAGIDFSPYAAEGKADAFAAAVLEGKFSRADKHFNAILEANKNSSKRGYVMGQMKKAHRIIMNELGKKPS